jgi:formylglycine-generating enzyme required for sulfatase activity
VIVFQRSGMRKTASWLVVLLLIALLFPSLSQANNLAISNVRLGARDSNTKTIAILFDISWDNSWRNKINHDAVWLTARLKDTQLTSDEARLCKMSLAGLNPGGTSAGLSSGLEVYVPKDRAGVFVRRAINHEMGDISAQSLMITLNYDSCGLTESAKIEALLFGLEMVFVPEGAFYAGDFAVSAASLRRGSSDNEPWYINSESEITVTSAAAHSFYYTSAGNPNEFATGSSFIIPAAFPKGFAPFYAMKYEISEGEWVAFVNSLPAENARAKRDITDNAHKYSDAVIARNTVSCSGTPLVCTTQRPSRSVSFLSWKDLCAFLDWAGLRPMTELEFEKLARGPLVPFQGEYAWANADAVAAEAISGTAEDGQETVTTKGANARFGNVLLTGGDSANGAEYQSGPLRGGVFATSTSDRLTSGAGYYGAMELSGNLKEWVVSIGNSGGLVFSGSQGDGILTAAAGYEGNANELGWPGMDVDPAKGVTGSSGSGLRGGSWSDVADRLHVSDRQEAARSADDAAATYGGRGVRMFDGV